MSRSIENVLARGAPDQIPEIDKESIWERGRSIRRRRRMKLLGVTTIVLLAIILPLFLILGNGRQTSEGTGSFDLAAFTEQSRARLE
jgi:hypothetical protein